MTAIKTVVLSDGKELTVGSLKFRGLKLFLEDIRKTNFSLPSAIVIDDTGQLSDKSLREFIMGSDLALRAMIVGGTNFKDVDSLDLTDVIKIATTVIELTDWKAVIELLKNLLSVVLPQDEPEATLNTGASV